MFLFLVHDLARYITYLGTAAIVLYIQMLPAEVLAWSQQVYGGQIIFTRSAHVLDTQPPLSRVFEPGTILGATASAYSSTPEQTSGDPFITASGSKTRSGVVAANFLPLGTKVRIGSRNYVVEDRMASRYNNQYRIDIWMESTEDAIHFGVQPVIVEILSIPE